MTTKTPWALLPIGLQLLLARLSYPIQPIRRAQKKFAEDVRSTGLFDDAFYRLENPYVDKIKMDPARHFALVGWKMDRRPNPFFSPSYYLEQCKWGVGPRMNPLLHYVNEGWRAGLRPSPQFDGKHYLDVNRDVAAANLNPLVHYLQHGRDEGRKGILPPDEEVPVVSSVSELVDAHSAAWRPLPIYEDVHAEPTVTIVLDVEHPDDVLSGTDTAIVVGVLAATRLKARLRVVSRQRAPDAASIGNVLRLHAIAWPGPSDFVHMPVGATRPLSVGRQDVFVTTSCSTTAAVAGSIPFDRILYVVHDDERTFYPHGDSRLRCSALLSNPQLRLLISGRSLYEQLASPPDQLDSLSNRAEVFAPACPAFPAPEAIETRPVQNFFFYASPDDDRTLFWRGVEVIAGCLQDGTLDPREWAFHFVGTAIPPMVLHETVQPIVHPGLSWNEYVRLMKTMDLGLCLRATPHSPHALRDLAASGAVVVTNAFEVETSLDHQSRNIVSASSSADGLRTAIAQGALLARNTAQRRANCVADTIPREWESGLRAAFEKLNIGAR